MKGEAKPVRVLMLEREYKRMTEDGYTHEAALRSTIIFGSDWGYSGRDVAEFVLEVTEKKSGASA